MSAMVLVGALLNFIFWKNLAEIGNNSLIQKYREQFPDEACLPYWAPRGEYRDFVSQRVIH